MTRPQINPIVARAIDPIPSIHLSNGIEVFYFDGAPQEIIKVELLFEGGRWSESGRQVAKSASRLIKTGTTAKKAHEIQEEIDFLGASIKVSSGYNYTNIEMFCLLDKLEKSLNILYEILSDAVYSKKELDIYKDKQISRLAIEEEKNEFVADQSFKAHVFGENHPYGYLSSAEDYDELTIDQLQHYYNQFINPENCQIIISGKVNSKAIKLVDDYVGKKNWSKNNGIVPIFHQKSNKTFQSTTKHIFMDDSVQNAIVIGGNFIEISNPDYNSFALLNTIFGGYFGSRLMNNIREEKGFTYGIYSGMQRYKNGASVWSIQTETGNDYLKPCLKEIYKEIDVIKKELVPEEELRVAKNYFLGSMLRRTDGPFSLSSTFKGYLMLGLSVEYFNNLIRDVEQTDAETLINLAQKYLIQENFVEIVVGKV